MNSPPISVVRDRLSTLFGGDAVALTQLCLNKADYPLGFDHVPMLSQLAGVSIQGELPLCLGYVFLSAYYFLLDSITDGHVDDILHAVRLSQLNTAFWIQLEEASIGLSEEARQHRNATIAHYVSKNAQAVLLEHELQSAPFAIDEVRDRESTIGRGNSFILFYELLCILGARMPNDLVLALLSDLVYSIQMSDDLVDWESDYARRRWTPLLRSCFKASGRLLSFKELQLEIYTGGWFEESVALTIGRLRSIRSRLLRQPDLSSSHLQQYLRAHENNLTHALRASVTTKLALKSR